MQKESLKKTLAVGPCFSSAVDEAIRMRRFTAQRRGFTAQRREGLIVNCELIYASTGGQLEAVADYLHTGRVSLELLVCIATNNLKNRNRDIQTDSPGFEPSPPEAE